MGKGQGAPAAAFIGLFVAPQLVEGTRLAEQCPDTLAVQAQRLLTVLQCLLIQALGETIRRPNGQHLSTLGRKTYLLVSTLTLGMESILTFRQKNSKGTASGTRLRSFRAEVRAGG